MGTAWAKPNFPSRDVITHFNACRWDAAWRLAQPCGNGGQLALMGANVTRSSLGWFFVHAPGIDEALLLIDRTDSYFVNKRLQAVTDGRGQLIAIADSSGQLLEAYAGSGHDQSSWQGAGLTTQAQSFNPRKWQTDETWGGIQQFRNRAYDPATGTWIQEVPMGVAGGVNVYRFNNGNPVSFGDPFGLCPEEKGGDGKTEGLEDCPEGSEGWKEYQRSQEDARAAVVACMERRTAWMRSENAFVAGAVGVFGGTGATISGMIGQAAGREQIMRGTVDLDLFFGVRGTGSGLVDGGIGLVNAGKSLVATGRGLVRGGLVTLAVQGAFVASYLATTGALCHANPTD